MNRVDIGWVINQMHTSTTTSSCGVMVWVSVSAGLGSYNYFHCNHRHNDSHIISEIMTQPHVTKPVTTLSRVRQPIIIACGHQILHQIKPELIYPILCFRYYIYGMSELWLRATSLSRLRPANKWWSRETETSEAALVFCSRPALQGAVLLQVWPLQKGYLHHAAAGWAAQWFILGSTTHPTPSQSR